MPVSPRELAAHAKCLFSGVREPVLLLGSFGLFCNEGVVVSRMPRLQVWQWERRRNRKRKVGAALDRKSTSFPSIPPSLPPFRFHCETLGHRISPGVGGEMLSTPPDLAPGGITTPIPAKLGCGSSFPTLPLAPACVPSPKLSSSRASSPSPLFFFFFASSSSPHPTLPRLAPGSRSLCQSQHGPARRSARPGADSPPASHRQVGNK